MRDDKQLFVTIVIDTARFSDLRAAASYLESCLEQLKHERCDTFNHSDYLWRKDMVDEYDQTVRAGRLLPPHLKRYFLDRIHVDRSKYMLSVAPLDGK